MPRGKKSLSNRVRGSLDRAGQSGGAGNEGGVAGRQKARIGEVAVRWLVALAIEKRRAVEAGDLAPGGDQNGMPLVSLAEVFESGQWAEGSRALLSYVQESDLDARRFVVMCIDNSDSD